MNEYRVISEESGSGRQSISTEYASDVSEAIKHFTDRGTDKMENIIEIVMTARF